MLPQEIIRKKRDQQKLSNEDIQSFMRGIVEGKVSEGQTAAMCMAIVLNGMDMEERVSLTTAMAHSGRVMEWQSENLNGPILDKHSTGGIGDKVSLILAPIIAACGGYVPMISGRGLGHTGGTLDKMDAIPGYVSQPDLNLLKKAVRETGAAIIGATPDLAPADRTVYAIRDVTATVESIDLITASILSKKLAAGLDALIMDVKYGTGAFMQNYDEAKQLADSLVAVANGAGMPTVALLTDMNQVLGRNAGNALEVYETVDFLTGKARDQRLYEVTVSLTAELLVLGNLAETIVEARQYIDAVLENGKAAEKFAQMIHVLGGPSDLLEKPDLYLAAAPVIREIYPETPGVVSQIDARAIGIGIVKMGGGRAAPTDDIDYRVGLSNVAQIGETVGVGGRPLAIVHAKDETMAEIMAQDIKQAVLTAEQAEQSGAVIKERIAA